MLDPLFGSGAFDEALEVAAAITDRSEDDVTAVVNAVAARARILSLRGQASEVAGSLEWLESTARGTGAPEYAVIGLTAAAFARAALGQNAAAAALLAEVLATPGARAIQYYGVYLPTMVRTALGLGDRPLAERLVDGYVSPHPFAALAAVTVSAALNEARGDQQSGGRRLRRGRRTLAAVRGRPRAGVRAARTGPLPGGIRATDRSDAGTETGPGDLRNARSRTGHRRD